MAESEQVEVVTQAFAETYLYGHVVIATLQFSRKFLAKLAESGWTVVPLPTLGSTPNVHRGDPDTSHEGSAFIQHRRGSLWHQILAEYAQEEGTDEEIAEELSMGMAGVQKRCTELRQAGMIEDTGQRRDGRARVPRMVCRITDLGRAELVRLNV